MTSKILLVLLLSGVVASVASSEAIADGGTSIAGAPVAVLGQQEFGNTINGGMGQPGCFSSTGNTYRSWWAIPVKAGDALTLDWETQSPSMYMNLFPVGTTDYTFSNTSPLVQENVGSNFKAEGTYTAIQDGTMPLEFFSDTGCGNDPAPYDFTASVLHGVVLSFTVPSTVPLRGSVPVAVHDPDGNAIDDPQMAVTLKVRTDGAWTAVGTAAVAGGVASVSYSIPESFAGSKVELAATSTAPGYVDQASAVQHATVETPPCVVPALVANEPPASAKARLAAASCSVGKTFHVANSRFARGTVFKFSPAPGTTLATAAVVDLYVSIGAPCIVPTIPSSRSLAATRRLLATAHCVVGPVSHQRSAGIRKGRVIRLSRRAGLRLSPRTVVGIVVSRGRR